MSKLGNQLRLIADAPNPVIDNGKGVRALTVCFIREIADELDRLTLAVAALRRNNDALHDANSVLSNIRTPE